MARTRVHTGVIRTEPENAGWAKQADMQKNYADTGKAVRPRHAPATDQTMATAKNGRQRKRWRCRRFLPSGETPHARDIPGMRHLWHEAENPTRSCTPGVVENAPRTGKLMGNSRGIITQ